MFKNKLAIVTLIAAAVVLIFYFTGGYVLLVKDAEGRPLMEIKIQPQQEFLITFVHSSELEPWDNLFVVNEKGELILKEIRVPSTGPGVPSVLEEGWDFEIQDGYLIYKDVDKKFEEIDFIVSPISPHYLIIEGEKINLVDVAGEWAEITVQVGKDYGF